MKSLFSTVIMEHTPVNGMAKIRVEREEFSSASESEQINGNIAKIR